MFPAMWSGSWPVQGSWPPVGQSCRPTAKKCFSQMLIFPVHPPCVSLWGTPGLKLESDLGGQPKANGYTVTSPGGPSLLLMRLFIPFAFGKEAQRADMRFLSDCVRMSDKKRTTATRDEQVPRPYPAGPHVRRRSACAHHLVSDATSE